MTHSKVGRDLRIFYVFIVLCMSLGVYAVHAANEKSLRVCLRTELTKVYALGTLDRSLKTLPTLAYYKEHPLELRIQLRNVRETRHDFLPSPCDPGLLGLF